MKTIDASQIDAAASNNGRRVLFTRVGKRTDDAEENP